LRLIAIWWTPFRIVGTAANPLVAAASKLLIEAGGAAVRAETDEPLVRRAGLVANLDDWLIATECG
jgi:altronate dehydratase